MLDHQVNKAVGSVCWSIVLWKKMSSSSSRTTRFFACLKTNIRHAMYNQLDVRYWIRGGLFLLVDAILLVISTVQNWEDQVARVFLMLANTFLVISIVFFTWFSFRQLRERKHLHEAFKAADSNHDGLLNEEEMRALLKSYPAGSFKKFKIRGRLIHFSTLSFARTSPRSHLFLQLSQFFADWLSFFSTLILFNAASRSDRLVIAQGIIAVLDFSLVLHELLSAYLSKYKVSNFCCLIILGLFYWTSTLTMTALFFSGFAVSLELAGFIPNQQIAGTRTTDVAKSPGFWTGWILSALIAIHISFYVTLYFCLSCCGCVTYRGRRKFGLLGRLGGSSQSMQAEDEELDDDFELDMMVGDMRNRVEQSLQVITNFSTSTDLKMMGGDGGGGGSQQLLDQQQPSPSDTSVSALSMRKKRSSFRWCCCCC